jgi:hypothetical protein
MAELPKYHLGPQHAEALLRPIRDGLRVYEARLGHYTSRLHLAAPTDQPRLVEAGQALAAARQALEGLVAAAAAEREAGR